MYFEGEIRKDGTKIRQNNGRKHLEIRGPGCGMVKADDSRVSSSFRRNRGSSVSLEPTLQLADRGIWVRFPVAFKQALRPIQPPIQ